MMEPQDNEKIHSDAPKKRKSSPTSLGLFPWLIRLIAMLTALTVVYWLFFASDRYVSEANIIIQRTDMMGGHEFDLSQVLTGVGAGSRPDQLLLREHLLSVDMLTKLDAALNLRAHYSDKRSDIISRMWFEDTEIEWFYRHYLSRVSIEFDDFAGVLRIKAQAYDPQTAHAITVMLVADGERFMNQIAHELATVQVTFLATQVQAAHDRLMQARGVLLEFQNKKGLVSPQATAENINTIIGHLEAQRTEIQTQLAALPTMLIQDHPNVMRLKQSLEAVEKQIEQERAKLASPAGEKHSLNYTLEEFQRLEMEVAFAQDIYKTALVGLERGRMEATRTIKKVSVLQAPVLPQYPDMPRKFYNSLVTLLFAGLLAGIVKLLEGIIRDHID
jgi:Capsule polysaccharide export protein